MQFLIDSIIKKNIIFFNKKTLLLSILTSIFVFSITVGCFYLLERIYQYEKIQADRESGISLEAFEKHTVQVVNQVDMILRSVRITYLSTGSVSQTLRFIEGMHFNSLIEGVLLVNSNGAFLIPDDKKSKTKDVLDRDYFNYHKTHSEDSLFISSVERGILTGKYCFRISRRINNPDGSFGGIVLGTVNPHSFTRYYQELNIGPQNVASLVGTLDKKYRARIPEAGPGLWNVLFDASLWELMKKSENGNFKYLSRVDHVPRDYRYKKVGDFPLVMVVGFSDEDIKYRILERKNWLVVLMVLFILFTLIVVSLLLKFIKTNELLKMEILERTRVQAALEEASAQVRVLEGIFPICSYCKKIRDDKGYWQQVDTYISRHSEALFSHSICPDCIRKNYPDLADNMLRELKDKNIL